MLNILNSINNVLWSNVLVLLLFLSGLYYTIRIGFAQFRRIPLMKRYLLEDATPTEGRTPFQAFALTLSTRVGTGNIAGVATAIAVGGPGAIFWMWVSALLGGATTIIEVCLSQVYKEKEGNEFRGGPQYFIEKGLGSTLFATLFAASSIVALGFCTPGVQANAIADAMDVAFGIDKQIMAFAIAILVAFVIFGGVKRIATVTEYMGPIMAGAYILFCLVLIIMNITRLPEIFSIIFTSAFGQNSVFGGVVGSAIIWGTKRGIYSNEAGMGTASQAAATPKVSHPAKQGIVQALSVFLDTLFICTATGFSILITGMYNVDNIVESLPGVQAGPAFVQNAFNTVVPGFGSSVVAIAMLFFAYSTILGNYYAAETGAAYIARKANKTEKNIVVLTLLRCATLLAIILFAARTSDLAWAIADVGMGVMSWFNLLAILLLSGIAIKVYKDFEKQLKETGDAVFRPGKLGLKNVDKDVWPD